MHAYLLLSIPINRNSAVQLPVLTCHTCTRSKPCQSVNGRPNIPFVSMPLSQNPNQLLLGWLQWQRCMLCSCYNNMPRKQYALKYVDESVTFSWDTHCYVTAQVAVICQDVRTYKQRTHKATLRTQKFKARTVAGHKRTLSCCSQDNCYSFLHVCTSIIIS